MLPWIEWAGFKANFGLMGDPLARGMAVLVSGVAFLVHIYSIGYLEKDPSRSRFFCGVVALCVFDAGDCFGGQFGFDVHFLGTCGAKLLSAYRILG